MPIARCVGAKLVLVYRSVRASPFLHAACVNSFSIHTGAKYTASYTQCAFQEYMHQAGSLYMGSISVLICGISWYVTRTVRPPSQRALWIGGAVTALLPAIAMGFSIYRRTARVYCNVDIEGYWETSCTTRRSIFSYYVFFVLLEQLCALSGLLFFILIYIQLQSAASVDVGGAVKGARDTVVVLFVRRLILYPLFFFFGWMPSGVTLGIILLTGKDFIPLRIFSNATTGSIGLLISVSYFYFQIPVKDSPKAMNYLRQSIFNSPAFASDCCYDFEADPMCSGHELRDTASLSVSMGPNSSQTDTDRPSSQWKSEVALEGNEEDGYGNIASETRTDSSIQLPEVYK